MGVFADGAGSIFIADTFNNRIREVLAPTGIIQTIAGSGPFGIEHGGFGGYAGDGGPATSAQLGTPTGIYLDAAGNVFIGDEGTPAGIPGIGPPVSAGIREVTAATGIINRVAGFGNEAGCGGWPATIQYLTLPFGLLVDAHGNIFTDCNLRYLIEIPSTGDVVQQIAGNGTEGYSGDGQIGTSAALDLGGSVNLGPDGGGGITEYANSLFIADTGNNRIRQVSPFAGAALPTTLIPLGLVFGPQDFGTTSVPLSAKLTSFGTIPLKLSSLTITTNPNLDPNYYRSAPDEFAVANTTTCSPGASIESGTSCSLDLTATPDINTILSGQALKFGSALLSIADNASTSPHTFLLQDIGVIPAEWNIGSFPDQTVGTTSLPQAATITNTGNVPLTFPSLPTIAGTNGSDFAVAGSTTCTPGSPLAVGATCSIEVTFTPGATGNRSGTITAYVDAGNTPIKMVGQNGVGDTLSLTGVGTIPQVGLTNPGFFFGNQLINTTSPPASLGVLNESYAFGKDILTITSPPSISGTNASDFAIASATTCANGATIPSTLPASSCTIVITFTPQGTGTRTATLTIFDDGIGDGDGGAQGLGSQTMSLVGQGIAPNAPAIAFDAKSLSFPSQVVSTTSAAQNVVITSTGNAPLMLNSITMTGANAADFKLGATNCPIAPLVLAGGCPIPVSFAPTAAGMRTATLSVTDNAPGSPQNVVLTGTGLDFSISAAAGQTSATITAGQTATYNLQLAPSGFSGTVALACVGAPAGAICTASPSSLLLDGSTPASFTVSVATRARSAMGPRDLPMPHLLQVWPVFFAFALALFGVFACTGENNAKRKLVFASIVLTFAAALTSCTGGGGSTGATTTISVPAAQGTPPGSSVLTVTAMSGSLTRTLALSLTVN